MTFLGRLATDVNYRYHTLMMLILSSDKGTVTRVLSQTLPRLEGAGGQTQCEQLNADVTHTIRRLRFL